jgi:hypothetical protein
MKRQEWADFKCDPSYNEHVGTIFQDLLGGSEMEVS